MKKARCEIGFTPGLTSRVASNVLCGLRNNIKASVEEPRYCLSHFMHFDEHRVI